MTSPSNARSIPVETERSPRNASPTIDPSISRSTARLASPIPSINNSRRVSEGNRTPDLTIPLPGLNEANHSGSMGQPGPSALASALNSSLERSPPRNTMRSLGEASQTQSEPHPSRNILSGSYGSFARSPTRNHISSRTNSPAPFEDFDIVRKHLAGPLNSSSHMHNIAPGRKKSNHDLVSGDSSTAPVDAADPTDLIDGFSSLRLQGGDVHREIYRRTELEATSRRTRNQRSKSLGILPSENEEQELNVDDILQPGGFRREHILRNQPGVFSHGAVVSSTLPGISSPHNPRNFLTSNFLEFLSLYGHFAGEDYEEDEDDEVDYVAGTAEVDDIDGDETLAESRPLLKRRQSKRKKDERSKNGTMGTVLILLKSFVGTGVLFLPRAFLNGGMAFSVIVLALTAGLSYYCFLLLTTSRLKLKNSYAEMGEMTYGVRMRTLINTSLVISQIGFASAYIVFTSENLRAFILAVSHCKTDIDIKLMILMQLIVFLPLSLYRNLGSLSFVVYVADIFIVLGLIYLYYYGFSTVIDHRGVADITMFNKDTWTLFIGTAIFTFEGIGLIIPIQDGMKKPQQLPAVLSGVMIIITVIFVSMGALSYAAYGSKTQTVIIKNMDQSNKLVNGIQFIYSVAILLSTPMQIFPAITILEKGLFSKSGKFSKHIKWAKNVFRFGVVLLCALIAWVGANDLDKFVALVGSFACIPLVYIYPPLIHRKAVDSSTIKLTIDVMLVVFGFVLMAYTSVLTITSWVRSSAGGGNDVGYCSP